MTRAAAHSFSSRPGYRSCWESEWPWPLACGCSSASPQFPPSPSSPRQFREDASAAFWLPRSRRPSNKTEPDDGGAHRPPRNSSMPSAQPLSPQETRGRNQLTPPRTDTTQGRSESRDVWLRLGTSPQKPGLRSIHADPNFQPPQLGPVPVVLDPSIQTVSFAGPEAKVQGMFRFLLMQLAAFPNAINLRVLIHGPIALLPSSARFLPRVTLTTDTSSAAGCSFRAHGRTGSAVSPWVRA